MSILAIFGFISLGTIIGFTTCAILTAGSIADDQMEQERMKHDIGKLMGR